MNPCAPRQPCHVAPPADPRMPRHCPMPGTSTRTQTATLTLRQLSLPTPVHSAPLAGAHRKLPCLPLPCPFHKEEGQVAKTGSYGDGPGVRCEMGTWMGGDARPGEREGGRLVVSSGKISRCVHPETSTTVQSAHTHHLKSSWDLCNHSLQLPSLLPSHPQAPTDWL